MRASRFLSWLAAPLVAVGVAAVSTTPQSTPSDVAVTHAAQHSAVAYTTDGIIARLNFAVPRQDDDDDSFRFTIEAVRDPHSTACGSLHVYVNGQLLERAWTKDSFGHASSLPTRFTLLAEDIVRQANHTLSLQTSSHCLSQSAGTTAAETVEVITFQLFTIDGQHVTHLPAAFITSFATSHNTIRSDLTWANLPASPAASITATVSPAQDFRDASIEDEILRLNHLEAEYTGLRRLYEGQQQLVTDLGRAEYDLAKDELKNCETMGCVVKTLYEKTRGCLHLMYLRYGPESGRNDILTATDDDPDCVYAESPTSRAKVLMSHQKLCPNSTHRTGTFQTITQLNSTPPPIPTTHNRALHLTLDVVVAVLLLSCLFALLHHRCLNPRKAAERAARREERLARQAYLRAARKHAFKRWWTRHRWWGGEDQRRIQDYDEKRRMILRQEGVLEEVMQAEIDRLRDEAGGDNHAVEEGRSHRGSLSRSRTHSLPPTYRSRASSVRPPSYTSFEEIHVVPRVVDGFHGYSPGGTMSGTTLVSNDSRAYRPEFEDNDRTPASSVFTLSPRPSYETLRTEKSSR